eukprot:15365791-Ditylum_brightwellii.AAC.1
MGSGHPGTCQRQLNLANDVGGKVNSLLIKLYMAHRKDTLNIFSENKGQSKVEHFQKAAKDIKDLLDYNVIDDHNKNVTMIIYVTTFIPFRQFKNRMFNCLKLNNIILNVMIFCNTKETVIRIGYLTKISLVRIYYANCQEQLNNTLDIVAAEVEQEDDAYFQNNDTTVVEANYKVQIKPSKPFIVAGQNHVKTNALSVYTLRSHARISQDIRLSHALHHYANLLKEQNQYLANYKDFCISGVSNEMLSREFEGQTLQDHLELQGVVGDIMHTVFMETKGIWQVESATKQVVKAMYHVTEILDKYKSSLPDDEKERYTALLFPLILNTYTVPPTYARMPVSDIEIANSTLYNKPPNTWSRGPPTGTATNSSAQKIL